MGTAFDTLRAGFLYHLDSLKNFQFTPLNPVFWLFLLLLFLILLRFWLVKKSFSFCLIVAIVLLATTKLEDFLVNKLAKSVEIFDPKIIRLFPIVVISFVFLYYAFIKRNGE